MGLEVVYAVFIGGMNERFADVVQQHRKAQHPIGFDVIDAFADVGIDIIAMVRIVLRKVKAGCELGYDDCKDITVPEQYPCGVTSAQQLFQLGGDTLC